MHEACAQVRKDRSKLSSRRIEWQRWTTKSISSKQIISSRMLWTMVVFTWRRFPRPPRNMATLRQWCQMDGQMDSPQWSIWATPSFIYMLDWLYVCMYVCMLECACVCVCMNVCMLECACVCVCMYVCMYVCMHDMSNCCIWCGHGCWFDYSYPRSRWPLRWWWPCPFMSIIACAQKGDGGMAEQILK